MKTKLWLCILLLLTIFQSFSQPCTTSGDETTYGTNNTWIGYLYDNTNFTTYRSYITEGNVGSPAFDQSFGGDNVNYNTSGCFVYTETFSARYKLTKTFANGDYEFVVGGDDGYRLSIDGGSTWIIDNWGDHGYTTSTYSVHLNGTRNMVLEYYENGGGNRISFDVQATCTGSGSQTVYGTGDVWIGYVYDGTAFNIYKGSVTEGTPSNANFDESFGGSNTMYATSGCAVQTETFSVRYRLTKNFIAGTYIFTVGGDDGFRLSVNGGATWLINRWGDQSYTISTETAFLSGNNNLVLEYYENGGDNRVSFNYSTGVLPINLVSFKADYLDNKVKAKWEVTANSTVDHFEIERSIDGVHFAKLDKVQAAQGNLTATNIVYNFTDNNLLPGISFYRLKMFDISGEVTYSGIAQVHSEDAKQDINIYPTISNGNLSIVSAQKLESATAILYDLSGKKIFSKNIGLISTGAKVSLSLQSVNTKGMLLLQLRNNERTVITKKIVLQ